MSRRVEDYIDNAVFLANRAEFLQELRFSMRGRLSAAVFTRPEALGDSLRRALTAIWEQACSGRKAPIWIE